jgi:hypothetical protein
MTLEQIGALCFGLVVGWITYRTLRRRNETVALSDIAAVIGAVGGAAIIGLFNQPGLFAGYSIGLAIGFFFYFIVALIIEGPEVSGFLGD